MAYKLVLRLKWYMEKIEQTNIIWQIVDFKLELCEANGEW